MFAAVAHMKVNGGGVILNMASIAGSSGLADRFAYSTSKGAVIAMTYSVARDYLACNIRCNCISPARVHTPFVDGYLRQHYPGREEIWGQVGPSRFSGQMAEPHEVAALALYLCSDAASLRDGCGLSFRRRFLQPSWVAIFVCPSWSGSSAWTCG